VSPRRRDPRFVVGRAVIAGGSRLPLWVAATHDGIFFFSQVKVIAAGEVAQLFLVSWRTFTLCPAIGLHPAWCHRARTYLMNCLSVIC